MHYYISLKDQKKKGRGLGLLICPERNLKGEWDDLGSLFSFVSFGCGSWFGSVRFDCGSGSVSFHFIDDHDDDDHDMMMALPEGALLHALMVTNDTPGIRAWV